MTITDKLKLLAEPIPADRLHWRIAQAGKKKNGSWWAKILVYRDLRDDQDRLDEVMGPENWKNELREDQPGRVLAGISLRVGRGISLEKDAEWITKWDGAGDTAIEGEKGGISDALKRAAVQWGLGRYLYRIGDTWADISEGEQSGWEKSRVRDKKTGAEEWIWFRPPKKAYKELGYKDAEIATLRFYAADPNKPLVGSGTGVKMPAPEIAYPQDREKVILPMVGMSDPAAVSAHVNGMADPWANETWWPDVLLFRDAIKNMLETGTDASGLKIAFGQWAHKFKDDDELAGWWSKAVHEHAVRKGIKSKE